ncbi:hypothetical protein V6259_15870 [Marinomonas sp. TI.3.20]|uniref:hypothetical protein n=1 Tax=Marinomonas sp. TI.3.20 TaxID=3121296 RepID=UPI00311E709C
MLEPIIQEETTGCGIASAANILGKSYAEMKAIANNMGKATDVKAFENNYEGMSYGSFNGS